MTGPMIPDNIPPKRRVNVSRSSGIAYNSTTVHAFHPLIDSLFLIGKSGTIRYRNSFTERGPHHVAVLDPGLRFSRLPKALRENELGFAVNGPSGRMILYAQKHKMAHSIAQDVLQKLAYFNPAGGGIHYHLIRPKGVIHFGKDGKPSVIFVTPDLPQSDLCSNTRLFKKEMIVFFRSLAAKGASKAELRRFAGHVPTLMTFKDHLGVIYPEDMIRVLEGSEHDPILHQIFG